MFRSPSAAGLPQFATMVDDLHCTRPQLAKHLGISLATLTRYLKTEHVPRAVMLAVFWETKWGRSAADCEAANFAALYFRKSCTLERELQRMAGVLARLESEFDQVHVTRPGQAANFPIYRVR